jgi:Uma2 family endonuclease
MGEPDLKRMTADEFLVWQQSQERNYELVDGFAVLPPKAMTGATHAHNLVTVNLIRELANQLRRTACRPATDDIALRMPAGNVRRPDVLVECGKAEPGGTFAVAPRLVAEVLSPSTMNYDRVRKLEEYKTVPSLAYILLIDTGKPALALYVRDAAGWTPHFHETLEATLDLPEIGCRVAARDLFEGLPFAP